MANNLAAACGFCGRVPFSEAGCACGEKDDSEIFNAFNEIPDGCARRRGKKVKGLKLLGPRLWAPPWQSWMRPRLQETTDLVVPTVSSPLMIASVVKEKPEREGTGSVVQCKCGDSCIINNKRSVQWSHAEDPVEEELTEAKKTSKKESISVKDIEHNKILTLSTVLVELGYKSRTSSFISLMSFVQIAIKALRAKILRFKHRARFAAMNFSGTRKKIVETLNDIFVSILTYSGCCYEIYAKGDETVRPVPPDCQGPYIVCCTGLSGDIESLECGLECGTIFSIYRRDPKIPSTAPRTANLTSKYLVSAGYALYTSSTILVLSVGNKLCSFILDCVVDEFILQDDGMVIPEKGLQISVDGGHSGLWEPQILEYIKRKKDPKLGRPLKTHYVGSLVADFHRTLCMGGIYLYPANRKHPQGNTTLLCESVPLAHIVDLAGGAASTGKSDVLDTEPDLLGQYIPLFIGSKNEVQELLTITSSAGRS